VGEGSRRPAPAIYQPRGQWTDLRLAKALLGLQGTQQTALALRVIDEHLTVRQTEALVQAAQQKTEDKPRRAAPAPSSDLEQRLAGRFGLPVRLQQNGAGRGKLTVSFRSAQELDRLLAALES
jgi:ParB family chromosome partitioning protein